MDVTGSHYIITGGLADVAIYIMPFLVIFVSINAEDDMSLLIHLPGVPKRAT